MPSREFHCRAILFDLDGTLIDSLAAVDRAWTLLCQHYGLDSADVLNRIHGRRVEDSLLDVAPHLDSAAAGDYLFRIESTDTEGVTALPGSLEFLGRLPQDAWTIVTSGASAVAKARLRATGIPIPPKAVYAEDITEGKPSPQPFLLGAKRLGRRPEECVVFEDTIAGVRAARAAGMIALAIGEAAASEAKAWAADLAHVGLELDEGQIVIKI